MGRRHGVALVALSLLLAASAAHATPPRRLVERARSGALRAELSYLQTVETESSVVRGRTTRFTLTRDTDFRVTLSRAGRPLASRALHCDLCQPAGADELPARPSLHFARLRAGGDPQLLVDLFTGGAHCCFLSDVFLLAGSRVAVVEHDWGDPDYRLEDLGDDGVFELVTADDRFAYAFTDYAASLLPIEILRLEGSSLVEVTRAYPALVAADATAAWALYLRVRSSGVPDVRGILAAWAADEALLGRWSAATAALDRALARGDLDHGPAIAGWPSGRGYLDALGRFLRRLGYLRR